MIACFWFKLVILSEVKRMYHNTCNTFNILE